MNNNSQRALLNIAGRLLLLALTCMLLSVLVQKLPNFANFNQQWMDSQTRDNGWHGVLNYLLAVTLLLSLGLPRQLAAFLAGYAFGFLQGLLLSMLAVTMSCLCTVALARLFARPLARLFFAKRVNQLDAFLYQHTFTKAIVLRLLPVGNNLLTNIVAGMSSTGIKPFVLGSVVGYLPQMMIFALMGKGVMLQSGWKIGLSLALFAISSLLSWYLYQQYRATQPLLPPDEPAAAGEQSR
ncbi:TVP38/TMEM64 family protein [Rheinheimera sp. 4Y26]|uniref:TVP38/TMEM64 family protein n=1 Tax=Rheinheimera sp. 4Y26 TaxID=2977811 RepID=UPI0021B0EB78|nr:VTT domain-containing protein [Rheinheimera sp. 4Y26]MCT6700778.1 VTT domain-containing protein [Rheinheimera sp. 4Y26]